MTIEECVTPPPLEAAASSSSIHSRDTVPQILSMLSLASSLTSATSVRQLLREHHLSLGLSVLCDGTIGFDRSLCERNLPAASKRNYLSPRRTRLAYKQVPFVAFHII
jgi:hypothetical protein